MAGATYLCQIGCHVDCAHGLPCLVFRYDAEHPHPPRHIADAGDGTLHEWRGSKGKGRCEISTVPDDA